MQDVFLNGRPDPPHGVGRKAKALFRVEAIDGLHHADIAFGNQLANRQPITAVAHGNFNDKPEMAGDHTVGGIIVGLVAPFPGQARLLFKLQHRKLSDFLKVATQIAFGGGFKI